MSRRALFVSSIVAVLSVVLVPSASAHGLAWVEQFGSAQPDTAWSVAVTGGAAYVGGETEGTCPGKTSHGSLDAFLVKYNASGTKVWARQFGTPEADIAYGVAADATGIYVVGQTTGAFPGETAKGAGDGFVRKYTPTGDTAWTVQFGTKAAEVPRMSRWVPTGSP